MRQLRKNRKSRDVRKVGLGGLPFFKDLAFDFNTRTDLVLNNRIGDNGSFIGGYVMSFAGTEYLTIPEIIISEGDSLLFTSVPDNVTLKTIFGKNANSFIRIASQNQINIFISNSEGNFLTAKTITLSDNLSISNKYDFDISISGGIIYISINNGDITGQSSAITGTPYIFIDKIGSRGSTDNYEGLLFDINFNNEAIYYGNNAINSINGVAATNNGVTFTLINDTQLQSVKDALNEGYYIDGSGNKIINPQYAATTEEVVLGGKFYNGIECFSDFEPKSSSNTELIANPTLEINDNGYTVTNSDEVTTQGRNTINPISGVADYKLAVTTAGTSNTSPKLDIDYNTTFQLLGKKILISFDYKVNSGTCILTLLRNGLAGETDAVSYTLSGSGKYIHIMYCNDTDDNTADRIRLWFDGTNEFEVQLDNISVKELDAKYYMLDRRTQETASTDSVYYDSDFPFRYFMGKFNFDISPTETITAYGELDYNVIQTYLTSSYMQLIFTKISQNYGDGNEDYIDRILAYTTQKTGDELLRVLRYINYLDYTLNYVQDEDGNYVLDEYNRLIVKKL